MDRSFLVGAVVGDGWISGVMDWLLGAIVYFVSGTAGDCSVTLKIWRPTIESALEGRTWHWELVCECGKAGEKRA
jgi:hypothetical protein